VLKTKVNNSKKFFLLILFFILLILASESIYIIRNRPDVTHHYFINYHHLTKAKSLASKNLSQQAINELVKSANSGIKLVKKQYKDFIPGDFEAKINIPQENSNLQNDIISYIGSLDKLQIGKPYTEVYLSKIFYHLALIAHKNLEPNLSEKFFQTSIYLAPEYGTSHIELANLYLRQGDVEKSKLAYDFCSKFDYPKDYCFAYFKKNFNTKTTEEVGFLREDVEKHYLK